MSSRTNTQYSHTTRALHWISAVVILWATASGFFAAFLAGPELRSLLSYVNVSVTALFVPVFALRICNWLLSSAPQALDLPRAERRAAAFAHAGLYALTAVVLVSGVLMIERQIDIFDWHSLPRPVTNPTVNRLFARVHQCASALLAVLIGLHVAAVIRHERRGIRVLRRMTWQLPWRRNADSASRDTDNGAAARGDARDAGGASIFAHGDIGAMHVQAHRLLDTGRIVEGHRALGQWLAGRFGAGPEWVHIQFHMAVFELGIGDWDAAYDRFCRHILPAAANSEDALTDAPALLWRLQLAAPHRSDLPWQPLRHAALKRLQRPCDPFVELNNLMAVAGAGDLATIDRWLLTQPPCEDTGRQCLLRRAVIALRAYAARAYRQAADAFTGLLPHLPAIGGSLEQNRLFVEIAKSSRDR